MYSDLLKAPHLTGRASPDSSVGKESACSAGDPGSIPGLGRSLEEGKGYPLQYSGLENPMDCIVHGVAKGQTRLSNSHSHFSFDWGLKTFTIQISTTWWSYLLALPPCSHPSGLTASFPVPCSLGHFHSLFLSHGMVSTALCSAHSLTSFTSPDSGPSQMTLQGTAPSSPPMPLAL